MTALRKPDPAPGAVHGVEPVGVPRAILDAAAQLLSHKGYEATTVRAIATQVGIKAGSIYHHYPSKDAIVVAVVNEGVRVVLDAVEAALDALPPDASPRDQVEKAVRAHLLSSLENSEYTSASIRAFAFLPPHIRTSCSTERRKYEDVWRSIVADAARAGMIRPGISLDVVRLMLLGAVNWAGEWYRPGRLSIDEIAHDFAAALFGYGPG
jgi:AcrR family transcriptional regulator